MNRQGLVQGPVVWAVATLLVVSGLGPPGAIASARARVVSGPSATAALIAGTPDDDQLIGTRLADEIRGYGGADVIRPRAGDDTVFGGSGDDIIRVINPGFGHVGEPDWVDAGSGRDVVHMGGNDVALLGDGDDVARSGGGGVIRGGAGDDVLQAGEVDGGARLFGGPGNDIARVFSDDIDTRVVLIRLGPGSDQAKPEVWSSRGPGGVRIYLGSGPDLAFLGRASGSQDVVYAGRGSDQIRVGNEQTKLVDCGPGEDTLTLVDGAEPETVSNCENVLYVDGRGS